LLIGLIVGVFISDKIGEWTISTLSTSTIITEKTFSYGEILFIFQQNPILPIHLHYT
jgi:hypothetical protein